MEELTEQEWQVIWAIRDKQAKEVTINFLEKGKRRQLDIITTTVEHLILENDEKAIDHIKMGKYIDVRIKTQDGKSLYVERKKRRRV